MIGDRRLDRWIAQHPEVPDWKYALVVWPWALGQLALAGVLILLAIALIIGALLGVIVGIAKPINETSCNQTGAQLQLPADYRLLSDTCYVRVPGGRWVDANRYQVFQKGQR